MKSHTLADIEIYDVSHVLWINLLLKVGRCDHVTPHRCSAGEHCRRPAEDTSDDIDFL